MGPEIIPAPEEWRIIQAVPHYEVSSQGQVRRRTAGAGTYAGRVLRQDVGENGYHRVSLSDDAKVLRFSVHRLVCEAFHGAPPTSEHQAAHRNGIKSDNRRDNLRWATAKENIADIATYGPARAEENASHRKLTKAQVSEIRRARRSYGFAKRLSEKFGVSVSCIAAIRNPARGLWPSVPFGE